jgi:glycosyltransferase involved in cell wall biosynthesis
MTPLRIAMVNYFLPAAGRKVGGVDRVAHDLADGLGRRGHRVVVWSYDPAPPGAAYETRPLPGRRIFLHPVGRRLTLGYLGNLLSLFGDYRDADVLLAHGDSLLLPLWRKPVLRVVHGSALAEAASAASPWRRAAQLGVYVQELVSALAQPGCVAVSRNTTRHNPFVRRVIPNGVDLAAFAPDPAAKTEFPSVLFVGTLDGRKRGRLLVEWFRDHVRPRRPDARLWVVSAAGAPESGVQYFPGVGDAELARLYRAAWVYASPSRYEGFGLPYVEAMASGTPVLASPNPGSREVLGGGRFGVLSGDADFPAALAGLLADAGLRRELARCGLARAREYGREAMLDRYEALLEELCDAGDRRAAVA